MKVLKRIGLGLVAVVLLFVIVVMTRPPTFRIERSATVAAPPEAVYAQVADFRAWRRWSPWEGLDPALKRTYDGPAAGTGASYAWSGNDEAGEGKMTITGAEAPSNITVRVEFIKPFEATNTAKFTFVPAPGGTKVTWAMEGENGFIGKAFGMLMDMDKMVGADFEKGLGAMKQIVESKVTPPS
jgi:uncharacterized protein YndB with AHSA1/START domain